MLMATIWKAMGCAMALFLILNLIVAFSKKFLHFHCYLIIALVLHVFLILLDCFSRDRVLKIPKCNLLLFPIC